MFKINVKKEVANRFNNEYQEQRIFDVSISNYYIWNGIQEKFKKQKTVKINLSKMSMKTCKKISNREMHQRVKNYF